MHLVGQIAEGFQGVQQQRGGSAQQIGGTSGDDGPVRQLHGGSGIPGFRLPGQRGSHGGTLLRADSGLAHEKLQLANHLLPALSLLQITGSHVIAADDLLSGGELHRLIVEYAVARHVYAHVRGGLVGAATHDFLEQGFQHGEGLHIPVVVYGGEPVSVQVEGVDHVYIIQIRRGSLVGQVHRMIQGDVPDGEGFKFRIARLDAPLVFVVDLAQAGGKLAAAGAGGGDHHQGAGGFDVFVFAEALLADHKGCVGGVAFNAVVMVDPDAHALQAGLEGGGQGLAVEPGEYHAGNIQPKIPEHPNQANHVPVIGDAQIAPDFVLFNIVGVDGNDHLHLLLELQQHSQLAVRLKTGKHPGGMVVVIQLAAEFQIKLAAELGNAFLDMLGLHLQIFLVVKANFHHGFCLSLSTHSADYYTANPLQ